MKKPQDTPHVGQTEAQTEQTTENKPLKPRLSVQERWAKSAAAGVARAALLTDTQRLAQARQNSGWTASSSTPQAKPGQAIRTKGKKATSLTTKPPQAKKLRLAPPFVQKMADSIPMYPPPLKLSSKNTEIKPLKI